MRPKSETSDFGVRERVGVGVRGPLHKLGLAEAPPLPALHADSMKKLLAAEKDG